MDEKKMKFLSARDSICSYMKVYGFTPEEMKTVLQMCNDEIDAWEKRGNIVELNKEEE